MSVLPLPTTAYTAKITKKKMIEEDKKAKKKEVDRARDKTRVNIGVAFERWRELRDLKALKLILSWQCFCLTDDKGVFCTDLSQEYQLAASTFSLSRDAVWKLSERAVDCIFAGEGVKQQLRHKWAALKAGLLKRPELED